MANSVRVVLNVEDRSAFAATSAGITGYVTLDSKYGREGITLITSARQFVEEYYKGGNRTANASDAHWVAEDFLRFSNSLYVNNLRPADAEQSYSAIGDLAVVTQGTQGTQGVDIGASGVATNVAVSTYNPSGDYASVITINGVAYNVSVNDPQQPTQGIQNIDVGSQVGGTQAFPNSNFAAAETFDVTIDGVTTTITADDSGNTTTELQSTDTYDQVIAKIQLALTTTATVSLTNGDILITSTSTGVTSTVLIVDTDTIIADLVGFVAIDPAVDGTAGVTLKTLQDYLDAINTAISGAGVASLSGGDILITSNSTGVSSTVDVVDDGTDPMMSALAGFVAIDAAVDGTDEVPGGNPGSLAGTNPEDYVFGDEAAIIYNRDKGLLGHKFSVINDTTDPTLSVITVTDVNNVTLATYTVSNDPNAIDGVGVSLFIESVLQDTPWIRGLANPAKEQVTYDPTEIPTTIPNGADGSTVNSGQYVSSVEELDTLDARIVMDGGSQDVAYVKALVAKCESLRTCEAILGTPIPKATNSNHTLDTVSYVQSTLNLNSAYASVFAGWLQRVDPVSGLSRFIPPSGIVGGKLSTMMTNREWWDILPGDTNGRLNLPTDVSVHYTRGELDTLVQANINPIWFKVGSGIRIWDQRTAQSSNTARSDLNVQMLIIFIELAVESYLETFLHKLNTELLRSQIEAGLVNFGDTLVARNGVYDYRVFVISSDDDIDNGRIRVEFHVEPVRGVREIVYTTIIHRAGQLATLTATG